LDGQVGVLNHRPEGVAGGATLGARFDPKSNNFDLLRLALAVIVIFSHCFSETRRMREPIEKWLHYGSGGDLAVKAFLVISGFLVARSALGSGLDRYITSRVARILPGLALVTLVEVFLIGPLYSPDPPWVFLTYVGFRHLWNVTVFDIDSCMYGVFPAAHPAWVVNGSLWTIPVECSFYIVLPLALALPKRRVVFPLLLLASIVAERIASWEGLSAEQLGPALLTNVRTYHFIDLSSYFLAGASAWLLRDVIPFSKGALALCLTTLYAADQAILAPEVLKLVLPYIVLYFAVAGGAGSYLKRRIGDLSYGMYLFGFPLTLCLLTSLGNSLSVYALFGLATIASAACAFVSWHFVESPCLRFRTRAPHHVRRA